jgi:hypothetical protein
MTAIHKNCRSSWLSLLFPDDLALFANMDASRHDDLVMILSWKLHVYRLRLLFAPSIAGSAFS